MNDLYDVVADPTDFEHVLISFHSPFNWGESDKGAGVLESTDAGDNLGGPMSIRTAAIESDTVWSDFGAGSQIFNGGPFEFALDGANGILYTASTNAGVWALKIAN